MLARGNTACMHPNALERPETHTMEKGSAVTNSCVQAVNVQNDISQMVFVVADSPRPVEATVAKPGQNPSPLPRSVLLSEESLMVRLLCVRRNQCTTLRAGPV